MSFLLGVEIDRITLHLNTIDYISDYILLSDVGLIDSLLGLLWLLTRPIFKKSNFNLSALVVVKLVLKPLHSSLTRNLYVLRLEVHFKGIPPPVITWYRDNFEIQPSRDFQISTTETTSSLHVPEVFSEDAGLFTVKAYNKFGMVQCKAKLTVEGTGSKTC